jgi:hypothetical protein
MEEYELSELAITLRLRNNDIFLYEYVLLLAQEMFNGILEDYEYNDFESFEEAVEEAIGLTVYSMLDVEELEEEEFEVEFYKIKKRLQKISKIKGIEYE